MSKSKPWEINWEIIKPLGPSGQGNTAIVKNKTTEQEAIIKILKNQKSEQARRRMFREVTNLKVLNDAGCKVPKVFEHNLDLFEDVKIPLYFVMEKISGKTLLESVKEKNGLPIDDAIDLTLDLVNSFKIALNEDVLHRDIKPENIIVRSIKKHDAVVVDYGLSFNKDIDSDLTQLDESLDNKFLSMPERRVRGGSRRDPRSDLTGLCGIFFYCLTNEFPIDLRDEKGRAPHKRVENKIKNLGESEIVYSLLEAFFDQGFSLLIESRFQTIDDLLMRLKEIKNPGIKRTSESLEEFAKQTEELLLLHDRVSQLKLFRKNASLLGNVLAQVKNDYEGRIRRSFLIIISVLRPDLSKLLEGEDLEVNTTINVKSINHENSIQINYCVRASENQAILFRSVSKQIMSNPNTMTILEKWVPIYRYEGNGVPKLNMLKSDVEANILNAMKIIRKEILEKNEGNII